MAAITQLKKSRRIIFFVLLLTGFPGFAQNSLIPSQASLPVLDRIGIIPLRITGLDPGPALSDQIELIKTLFSRSLRETGRFKMLDDRLIEQMWASPGSRKELRDDYELSGFAHLIVTFNHDSIAFTARLLSPDLEPWLQESEIRTYPFFRAGDLEEFQEMVDGLFFRLINRIPVDVSVTSVQGKYVTLSGGIRQGLNPGDQIDLVRVFITSTHPALHTWRTFKSMPLGQARIVEAREKVAIAKLVWLIREDSIEVGDGARSSEIPSRAKFARMKPKEDPQDDPGKILIPGISVADAQGEDNPQKYEGHSPEIPLPPGFKGKEEWLKSPVGEPVTEEAPAPGDIPDSEKDLNYYLTNLADDLSFQAGQSGFSFSGPGATGSRFTWYQPVNSLGIRLTREVMPKIRYGFGGGIIFGKTRAAKGGFFGYNTHARLFWEDQAVFFDGFVQRWMVGGHGAMTGLGVNREGFGGYDAIQGGIFIGLKGQFKPGDKGTLWDWFGEFSLTPLTIGRIGYGNARHFVKSSFGWDLTTGAYRLKSPGNIEWGGGFSYGGHSIFDNNNKSTSLSFYSLSLLARWRF